MGNDQKQEDIALQISTAPARIFSRRKKALAEEIQQTEHLHSLRNEYISDLIAAIGRDKYLNYAKRRTQTRGKLRSIPKPTTVQLNDLSHEYAARKKILAESQQFIASLGIDGEKIKQIQRAYKNKIRGELETRLRDEKDIPAGSREAKKCLQL